MEKYAEVNSKIKFVKKKKKKHWHLLEDDKGLLDSLQPTFLGQTLHQSSKQIDSLFN